MPKVNRPLDLHNIRTLGSLALWKEIYPCCFCPTEYKRSRQEIKRKSLDTIKLQKKARKGEKSLELDPVIIILQAARLHCTGLFSLIWRHLEGANRSDGFKSKSKCMAQFQKLLSSLG